jgi:cyclic pyranopterin phosphate synthase
MPYYDAHQRPINYLRVSVTDRCNLRCLYCMPPEGVTPRDHDDILRYEEIEQVVRVAAGLGISRVRLTGGEPLVRAGIVSLVEMLARVPGIDDLSITTNGILLERYADALARAGLNRVNVSLDTLRDERYAQMTRGGRLREALAGIEAAERAGLAPVKINCVVLRGFNDDEVADMARLSVDHERHVRFIELMPLNHESHDMDSGFVSGTEIRDLITEALGTLEPVDAARGNGPAAYYRIPGARGTVGVITPVSEHFCGGCNRLRLTADGRLRPCLLSDVELDIKPVLRSDGGDEAVREWLRRAIAAKPAGHGLAQHDVPRGRTMSEIGG